MAIPIGVLALLGLVAYSMSGSKKSYRRNPSRRGSYSRRGSRSGGGFDIQKLILWGGGGLAAYMLLLRPGGILTPAMPRPGVPGVTPDQASIAAGLKAAPTLISSISKLFGGGSSTSSTPSGAPSGSQFVTDYSQLQPSQPASAPSDSEFVTSLT
jgi:hypothetical protein